jgi:RNA polymerase sigma-70 factor (ECF subfamily)
MDASGGWMAEIYESNSTAVFRICQRLLKDTEDAADATQEVFVRAFVSLKAETEREKARAWLITVARHHCLDVLRRKKRLGRALTRLGAEPVSDGEAERAVVDRNFVQAVLGQLRERERQALWQSAVEQRPLAEVATNLGLNYMAAAQFVHRARRHAFLVAAKLAAIIGFYAAVRATRRTSIAGARLLSSLRQPGSNVSAALASVLAAAVVPLLVATAVSSSSARDPIPVPTRATPAKIGTAPVQVITYDLPATGPLGGAPSSPSFSPGLASLPPVSALQAPGATLNSILSRIERTITQALPSPTPLPKTAR